jgi:cytochrome c-type biogenesis protein CcmF
LSRQTAIRAQTVLLSLITACVFLGTVFPVLVQAVGGDQLTVGAPWFNRTLAPLALATVALMALGPLVAWNRDDAGALVQRLVGPGIAALAAVGLIGLFGPGGIYLPVVGGLAVFVVATLARQLASRRGTGRRSRRRTGALVAHTGIALAAVAVVTTSYSTSEQQSLNIGDTMTAGNVSATLLGVESWEEERRSVAAARVLLGDDDNSLGIVEPELHFYPSHSMVVADPVAQTGWTREIQVSLVDVDPEEGSAAFRVTRTPMLWLLWASVAVTALGGAIAAWPARRRTTPPGPVAASVPRGRSRTLTKAAR